VTAEKRIGALRATLLVAGNMIGSGVFLLPATLGAVGSASLVGWFVSSLGALFLAVVFASLFRAMPDSVGLVQQVRDGLGRFFGFQTSLLYWFGCVLGNVAIAVAATGYLATFVPVLKQTWPAASCTIGLVWLFTGLNLFGARRVSEFKGLSLVFGLIPVVGAAVLGWFVFDARTFLESWNVSGKPDGQAIAGTFVPIFWAFLGLESASMAAAVVRDPERNVPIATLSGVALAAIVYIASSAAMMGLLPAQVLAQSTAPYADAAAKWLGSAAAALVAACAVLKTTGTLSGWLLVTAESSRSGAEAGVFPRIFAEPAAPPRRNLLIVAGLMTLAVVLSASPTIARQFAVLINLSTLLFLLIFTYCSAILLRLRPGWLTGAAALAAAGFCVFAASASSRMELIYAGVLVAFTVPLYALTRSRASPQRAS
jgi:arginine:agmatine antiporter